MWLQAQLDPGAQMTSSGHIPFSLNRSSLMEIIMITGNPDLHPPSLVYPQEGEHLLISIWQKSLQEDFEWSDLAGSWAQF